MRCECRCNNLEARLAYRPTGESGRPYLSGTRIASALGSCATSSTLSKRTDSAHAPGCPLGLVLRRCCTSCPTFRTPEGAKAGRVRDSFSSVCQDKGHFCPSESHPKAGENSFMNCSGYHTRTRAGCTALPPHLWAVGELLTDPSLASGLQAASVWAVLRVKDSADRVSAVERRSQSTESGGLAAGGNGQPHHRVAGPAGRRS